MHRVCIRPLVYKIRGQTRIAHSDNNHRNVCITVCVGMPVAGGLSLDIGHYP